MANIKSSQKANRQRITRTARNVARKTAMRTAVKRVRAAVDKKDAKAAKAALPGARIVADPLHLVRGANTALDTVGRERQRLARTGTSQGRAALRQGRLARRSLPRPSPAAQGARAAE